MDDESLDRLFSGNLDGLAPLPKRAVRLFISSTFTDMTLERNALMERVYPRLKKYCRERYGLDFQVVDMRWGVRDEATDDHQTVDLCSREIKNCQRVSLGPNFVALIGNKYGYRPLPSKIKSSEYRSLRRCLIESDINTDFLDTWYREDMNAVPAEYALQPISSILKNFTNKDEPEAQKVDQLIWQAIQERLHELLKIGSLRLVKQGRMSERDQLMRYSISVTEREVIEGCLDINEAKRHCLVYVRSIADIHEHLSKFFDELAAVGITSDSNESATAHGSNQLDVSLVSAVGRRKLPAAAAAEQSDICSGQNERARGRKDSSKNRRASLKIGDDSISLSASGAQTTAEKKVERKRRLIAKFIDLKTNSNGDWQVDQEAQRALELLRDEKVRHKLPANNRNLNYFNVHWNETDGMSSKMDEHKKYLNELSEHFYNQLTRMVRNAVKDEQKKRGVTNTGLVGEILQHSHYASQVGRSLRARTGELDQIKQYILYDYASISSGKKHLNDDEISWRQLPMFVYGMSGTGKTCILARAATQAREWIKAARQRRLSSILTPNMRMTDSSIQQHQLLGYSIDKWDREPCIIMRFCCTTPASSSMVGVLTSICRQLQYNFYQFGPLNGLCMDMLDLDEKQTNRSHYQGDNKAQDKSELASSQLPFCAIPSDPVQLAFVFRQLIENCRHPLHKKRMFVIILDSIERLSWPAESNAQARYSWLINIDKLPPNVRLIVSCSNSDQDDSLVHDFSDFKFLKRHFLRAQYEIFKQLHLKEAEYELNNDSYKSTTSDENEDELSQSSSCSNLIKQLANVSTNYNRTKQLVLQAPKFDGSHKYAMLKRIVMPAMRLIRFSRENALSSDLQQNGSNNKLSKKVVGFTATSANWPSNQRSSVLLSSGTQIGMANVALDRNCDDSPELDEVGQICSNPVIGMLHIKPLGKDLACKILSKWLAELGRNLTQQQFAIVERSFSHCSRPIFVKLTLGEVLNWKSYSTQGDTRGLSFGSAWLNEIKLNDMINSTEIIDKNNGTSFELRQLISTHISTEDETTDEQDENFRWQTLALEQQWLNFVDFKQRKEQDAKIGSKSESTSNDGLVIRISTSGATHVGGEQSKLKTISAPNQSTTTSSSLNATSSSSTSICHLSNTIEDAICQLFARIELQHGYLLTKHSLSYITAARSGICENELEDILSLDDVVLDDVFQYHLPPVRRIPPLLWTRIRNDLNDYLSERDADGIVIGWHYGQFQCVTEQRYMSDRRQLIYIHSIMADYFLGKWADKAKPFRCTKQQIFLAAEQLDSALQQSLRDSQQGANRSSLTGHTKSSGRLGSGSAFRSGASFSVRNRLRSSDQHEHRLQWMQAKADRRVPQQPLIYSSSPSEWLERGADNQASKLADKNMINGEKSSKNDDSYELDSAKSERRFNLRKLTELPYHLMRSGRFYDLALNVLFNYQWLSAAVNSIGTQSLFIDFEQSLDFLSEQLRQYNENKKNDDDANSSRIVVKNFIDITIDDEPGLQFDAFSLDLLIKQTRILNDTMRLSSSIVNSDPQMLAPQLVGRLLSVVKQFDASMKEKEETSSQPDEWAQNGNTFQQSVRRNWLHYLIEQCYRYGSLDCALLPIAPCFQPADGLLLSSLESHNNPFGITAMTLADDSRHLLTASKKILMWDVTTGEIVRDFTPPSTCTCIRDVNLAHGNHIGVAFSRENNLIAFNIQTQQVSLRACSDIRTPINGLKLIEPSQSITFFIWTDSLWRIYRLDETRIAARLSNNDIAQWADIEQEYEFNLSDCQYSEQILLHSVDIERNMHVDLTFLILAKQAEMKLITLELANRQNAFNQEKVNLWQESYKMSARLMLLANNLRQIIYCDFKGDIYLRRRRARSWSRAKLLRKFDSNTSQDFNAVCHSIQAIEAEPTAKTRTNHFDSNDYNERLAEFEDKIDPIETAAAAEETISNRVFSESTRNIDLFHSNSELNKNGHGLRFVKLYTSTQVIVIHLDKPNQFDKLFKESCCNLPRNIQNTSVGINKCQSSSIIVQAEQIGCNYNLIMATSRRLLVYSLDHEQLLENIDAHEARITSIILMCARNNQTSQMHGRRKTSTFGERTFASTAGLSSCLASASMDRTIKLWKLANIGKPNRPISKLNSAIKTIRISKSRPILVCLARGGTELGVWDWQTLKIIARWSPDELETIAMCHIDPEQSIGKKLVTIKRQTITAYDLSDNGNHMFVTTSNYGLLFKIQEINIQSSLSNPKPTNAFERENSKKLLRFSTVFAYCLPLHLIVLKTKFVLQDSRIIIIGRYPKYSQIEEQQLKEHSSTSTSHSRTSSQENSQRTDVELEKQNSRCVAIICLSVLDSKQVYSSNIQTPISDSFSPVKQFGVPQGKEGTVEQHVKSTHIVDNHSMRADTAATKLIRSKTTIVTPAITKDKQYIAALEYKPSDIASGENQLSYEFRPFHICLSVFSIREGNKVKCLDLNLDNEFNISSNRTNEDFRQDRSSLNRSTTDEVALRVSQTDKMKCIQNSDKITLVALIGKRTNSSILIDPGLVSGRNSITMNGMKLVKNWIGEISLDGRYGLSCQTSEQLLRGVDPNLARVDHQQANCLEKNNGIHLLESTQFSPVKTIIGTRKLLEYFSSETSEIIANFTKSDDPYVYMCDAKCLRILVIRLRDSQIVANYRSTIKIAKIKCSECKPNMIILGHVDGTISICTIVDSQEFNPTLADASIRVVAQK